MNLSNIKSYFTVHTWFLHVLMQLILITVPLLYIHDRWPTFGTTLLCILTVAGIVSHVCYSLQKKYVTILSLAVNLEKLNSFLIRIYTKPCFLHVSSYCLGLLTGNYLLKTNQLKFRKEIFTSCWISTISLLGLLFFGLHSSKTDFFPNESIIMAHQLLSPIAWTAITAWICVACISGYGGVVNKFLSFDFFVVMDRLGFWIYLMHPVVYLYVFGKIRSPYSVTDISLWMLFLLVMFLSTIGAVFCYMFLEIPVSYFLRECAFKKIYKKKDA
ncbi:O-acyltransferase like protein-like [Centruroides vittatus]|uniref:O-acyltransferase like protein-like n=1 Tax=Centruroides vittatus TaxID=120091 RepID=UPI0035103F4B